MKNLKKCIVSILICSSLFLFSLPIEAATDTALFAGGCFWCMEHDLEDIEGVAYVESGYAGGELEKPTYQNHDGHQEVVKVTYDSSQISFDQLLKSFWRNIDPFDSKGQFCDRGESYRPVIFYKDELQKKEAEKSFKSAARELSVNKNKIGVIMKKEDVFWIAEEYHQDFATNNSLKYNFYRYSCQRDKRLDQVWGKNARNGNDWE